MRGAFEYPHHIFGLRNKYNNLEAWISIIKVLQFQITDQPMTHSKEAWEHEQMHTHENKNMIKAKQLVLFSSAR